MSHKLRHGLAQLATGQLVPEDSALLCEASRNKQLENDALDIPKPEGLPVSQLPRPPNPSEISSTWGELVGITNFAGSRHFCAAKQKRMIYIQGAVLLLIIVV